MNEVAVIVDLPEPLLARVRAAAAPWPTRVTMPDAPCRSPVIFGNPNPQVVSENTDLAWLQLESVGFGEYAALDWSRAGRNVQVTNLAGFFGDPVAQTALAGILALLRGVDRLVVAQIEGAWLGDGLRTSLRTLTGLRVALLGAGAINSRLAELLQPFSCSVSHIRSGTPVEERDSVLATADLIVASVPDTPATRGLFDAERFASLKQGAIFCNLGRGSLVDEAALVASLYAGHLDGAVVDVTQEEPLDEDSPLWHAPRLLLTQHTAGGTKDELTCKVEVFADNMARFHAGQPLRGLVDFERGY